MTSGIVQSTQFAIADASLIDQLWSLYDDAFRDKRDCIEVQQCYSKGAFEQVMHDPAFVKFIIQDDSGGALGLQLATNDLQKAAAVVPFNPTTLAARFPAEATDGRIWYVVALAVRPDAQGRNLSATVIELLVEFAIERRGMVAFDHAIDKGDGFHEYAVGQFRKAIARRALKANSADYVPLGGQHYGVIVFDFPPDAPDPDSSDKDA